MQIEQWIINDIDYNKVIKKARAHAYSRMHTTDQRNNERKEMRGKVNARYIVYR